MTDHPPPSPPATDAAILDLGVLDRLRELDPDGRNGVLRRVLEAFDLSLVRMLAQLAAELDDGNPAVVATIAHTLKSSSAAVGALALSGACADVERRQRDGRGLSVHDDVAGLIAHGEAALRAVRAMLQA
jgi:HPt (histidine-containing phosphotransfer) domain-containing protein